MMADQFPECLVTHLRSISELSKEIQTARALMPDQLPQIETQDKPLIAR